MNNRGREFNFSGVSRNGYSKNVTLNCTAGRERGEREKKRKKVDPSTFSRSVVRVRFFLLSFFLFFSSPRSLADACMETTREQKHHHTQRASSDDAFREQACFFFFGLYAPAYVNTHLLSGRARVFFFLSAHTLLLQRGRKQKEGARPPFSLALYALFLHVYATKVITRFFLLFLLVLFDERDKPDRKSLRQREPMVS